MFTSKQECQVFFHENEDLTLEAVEQRYKELRTLYYHRITHLEDDIALLEKEQKALEKSRVQSTHLANNLSIKHGEKANFFYKQESTKEKEILSKIKEKQDQLNRIKPFCDEEIKKSGLYNEFCQIRNMRGLLLSHDIRTDEGNYNPPSPREVLSMGWKR